MGPMIGWKLERLWPFGACEPRCLVPDGQELRLHLGLTVAQKDSRQDDQQRDRQQPNENQGVSLYFTQTSMPLL